MKFTKLVVAMLLVSGVAQADSFMARGVVLDVKPRYVEREVPTEVCRNVQVPYQRRNDDYSYVGPSFGAIVGGTLGNSVGKGDGRRAATALGAAAGAILGDRYSNSGSSEYRSERRCEISIRTQSEQDGYFVTYMYMGRRMTAIVSERPYNDSIELEVSVEPRD